MQKNNDISLANALLGCGTGWKFGNISPNGDGGFLVSDALRDNISVIPCQEGSSS